VRRLADIRIADEPVGLLLSDDGSSFVWEVLCLADGEPFVGALGPEVPVDADEQGPAQDAESLKLCAVTHEQQRKEGVGLL
jgi:hypothetical protein